MNSDRRQNCIMCEAPRPTKNVAPLYHNMAQGTTQEQPVGALPTYYTPTYTNTSASSGDVPPTYGAGSSSSQQGSYGVGSSFVPSSGPSYVQRGESGPDLSSYLSPSQRYSSYGETEASAPPPGYEGEPGESKARLTPGSCFTFRAQSTGLNLRINDDGMVNGAGIDDPQSQFRVEPAEGGAIKLRNVSNPARFLRISSDMRLDGMGRGDSYCEFEVINNRNGTVSFRSIAHGEAYVGILYTAEIKAPQSIRKNYSGEITDSDAHFHFTTQTTVAGPTKKKKKMGYFSDGSLILLQSLSSKKYLTILRNGTVSGAGSGDKGSAFTVCDAGDGVIRLQDVEDAKYYLRITITGDIDGKGSASDPYSVFRIIPKGGTHVAIQSEEHNGYMSVGVEKNGSMADPNLTEEKNFGTFDVSPFGFM